MAVTKNFVVRYGLEVDSNLIFADSVYKKVGIGTTVATNTLQVVGGITATDINISGFGTISSISGENLSYNSGSISDGSIIDLSGVYLNYTGFGTVTFLEGFRLFYDEAYINSGIVTNISGINLDYSGLGTIRNLNGENLEYHSGIVTNISGENLDYSGIATVNALNIGNTSVISADRELRNIVSLDSVTTKTIEDAIESAPNNFADLNVAGISTLGSVKIDSGIITSVSGVVTYYGDGTYLDLSENPDVGGVGLGVSSGVLGYGVTFINFYGSNILESFYDPNVGIATFFIGTLDDSSMSSFALIKKLDDISEFFDNGTVTFELRMMGDLYTPINSDQVLINLGGVIQKPGIDYTVTSSNITFTSPPQNGLTFLGLILNEYVEKLIDPLDDISSSFDSITTSFGLSVGGISTTPVNSHHTLINVGGVTQIPGVDYTVSNSNIIFNEPPSSGLSFSGLSFHSIIGISSAIRLLKKVDDFSVLFDGSRRAFPLNIDSIPVSPFNSNQILVVLGGIVQNPGVDYQVNGSSIIFAHPPYKGLSFFGNIIGSTSSEIPLDFLNVSGASVLNEVFANAITLSGSNILSVGNIQISSGIITSTSGIVTYYGDGSQLDLSNNPNGITVQKDDSTVGAAGSIKLLNFIGSGVSVTSVNDIGINIQEVIYPPGNTIYVAMNGNDSNDGLTLEYAKRTIKSAVQISRPGDTIKVLPGTYVEDNPIVLHTDVSVEGSELRNCIVTPQNPGWDLFWVTNGNHITDLSFQGQPSTSNAAVIAFKPLVGVATNRYFDASRLIRYNLDFIASEAVGYLTSTDYQNPPFSLTSGDYTSCKDDIKDILKAICHDITRGGNSKCVGAGLSYYSDSTLQHIVGVKTETIDTIQYAAGIAKSCVNNVLWDGNYQSEFTQIRDLSIQPDPLTNSNIDIDSCANVISAIYSCVGVVTTIIDSGPSVVGTSFNLMYPGNAGIGTTNPNDVPSQGVGHVTKGPYIRNCTNFIPNSVGMRVDGFHAEPGDTLDMGITGMMSVDSYTQYNQGGIGVEVLNGAYAQLVSIFSICNHEAIVTRGGGQCDVTNSNSSFGTYGLVSDGVSDAHSLSIYRFTGYVESEANSGDFSVVIGGIGKEKPYSGQVIYFDELYYEIESVSIMGGGSGYTEPPLVIFPNQPTGPDAIPAEAISTIQNGEVVSVDIIGNGRNYRLSDIPTVTFSAPTGIGNTAWGIVKLRPLYYQVLSATPPSGGISTVTFAQPLNNDVGIGITAFLFRQSLQIVSSHSFEYIGAGNTIELARPSKGGVTVQENEVIKINGGQIVYTSTDQDGNFAIGEDLVINQSTGTISGRSFERSLLNTVTPFIIALGAK